MTTITFEYLEEPKLQFNQLFEHQDSKTGLAEYGPFGRTFPGFHPSEIRVGFIGTRETIAKAQEWFVMCGSRIESEKVRTLGTTHKRVSSDTGGLFAVDSALLSASEEKADQIIRIEKILNRDFVGFNLDSPFHSQFILNERWDRPIPPRDIDALIKIDDKVERIRQLVDLFDGYVESLATLSPSPDIIVLALTQEIADQADAARIAGKFFFNFRRAIKARAMRWGVPLQILQWRTVSGTDPDLQDRTLRAWNFCTAQYYKAEGVPWRPASVGRDTCFVGISFYIAQEQDGKLSMRSSVAQTFDHLGQGLVLRGEPFQWDERTRGPSPHLTQAAARKLMSETLRAYVKASGIPPRRVVVHKSSEYWGPEHESSAYNERDGLYEGIDDVFKGSDVDLVSLRQTSVHLFREGNYPPLRGTYICLDDRHHFLYTMGFIPYLETYPGLYVPTPWQIVDHHGGSSPKDLLREVLTLTKMNVNNCAFADGTPITLSFSRKIGDIMKHIPESGVIQPQYKYYM
jgi:hypothetical protein